MKGPSYLIDPPSPYEPPEVLWAFLRRLQDLDQEDPAVQEARLAVLSPQLLGGQEPSRARAALIHAPRPLNVVLDDHQFRQEAPPLTCASERQSPSYGWMRDALLVENAT